MSYDEYLQHHGILGMRWGKRNGPPYPLLRKNMSSAERAQNPKTSSDSNESASKVKTEKSISVETPNGNKTVPNSKKVKEMSDKELDAALSRMKKEKELRVLETNDITQGKAWVNALLLTLGGVAAGTYAAKIGAKIGNAGADKTESWVKDILGKIKSFKETHA